MFKCSHGSKIADVIVKNSDYWTSLKEKIPNDKKNSHKNNMLKR